MLSHSQSFHFVATFTLSDTSITLRFAANDTSFFLLSAPSTGFEPVFSTVTGWRVSPLLHEGVCSYMPGFQRTIQPSRVAGICTQTSTFKRRVRCCYATTPLGVAVRLYRIAMLSSLLDSFRCTLEGVSRVGFGSRFVLRISPCPIHPGVAMPGPVARSQDEPCGSLSV